MPERSLRSQPPRLIVLSDLSRAPLELFLERVAGLSGSAVAGSVLITLRDYSLSARRRIEIGERMARVARDRGQYFGVAERADLARLLEADALHLPEGGMPLDAARQLLGSPCFVSRAWHDFTALPEAGLDALLPSPILEPRKGAAALGVGALGALCARLEQRARLESSSPSPAVYALGGVGAENAASCLAAGAAGVAAIGAALEKDPLPLLQALGIARA